MDLESIYHVEGSCSYPVQILGEIKVKGVPEPEESNPLLRINERLGRGCYLITATNFSRLVKKIEAKASLEAKEKESKVIEIKESEENAQVIGNKEEREKINLIEENDSRMTQERKSRMDQERKSHMDQERKSGVAQEKETERKNSKIKKEKIGEEKKDKINEYFLGSSEPKEKEGSGKESQKRSIKEEKPPGNKESEANDEGNPKKKGKKTKRNPTKKEKSDKEISSKPKTRQRRKPKAKEERITTSPIPTKSPECADPEEEENLPKRPLKRIHYDSEIPKIKQESASENEEMGICSCQKLHCTKNQCSCFAKGSRCSVLCECIDCQNEEISGFGETSEDSDEEINKRTIDKQLNFNKSELEKDQKELAHLMKRLYLKRKGKL